MRCSNCGVEIQTGLNFCPDCGTPVPKVAPPSGFIGDVGMIKAETIHIDGGMPQPKLRPERPPQPAIPETREKKKKKMRVSGNEMTLTLADGVELELVRVPAGKFLMGSDKIGERPQHKLYLPEYLIGKHPVTVAQFTAFAKASGYKTTAEVEGSGYRTGSKWENVKGANWQQPRGPGSDVSQKAGHPVTQVSWEDAVAFCAWAGQVSGREVRLPSEAEWEKAARGTDGRIYPWGNQAADSSYCNFNMNEKDTTSAGKYSPKGDSLYGCTDMAGNVFEWTSSLYKAYPYNAKDGREDQKKRLGCPRGAGRRVLQRSVLRALCLPQRELPVLPWRLPRFSGVGVPHL